MSMFIEPRQPSALEIFSQAFVPQAVQPVNQLSQMLMQQAQNQPSANNTALGQLLGLEGEQLEAFSSLPPAEKKLFVSAQSKVDKPKSLITDEAREELTDTMKRQLDLIKTGSIGIAAPVNRIFSSEAREDIAEFNGLSARIEAALLPLVSKGTLAKDRFNYIISLLPKASDTDATNRGKLKALSREFGITLGELGQKKEQQKEKRSLGEIFE